ncbi:TetR/AcrR family transcriptional regulator [Sulfurospirillum oryzae]|uniref:TetR/AcrR family transcriptional regulator n=1 Tax=Sulfurospirillum oryzae TaxID=2976535 RepID=UPI0021E96799|nr:TetR/AcrR family transcriptional regulator [Sulfurospirillum oryzae]
MDKKRRKSEKILEAALMLFSTQGFYATTIPDIAKAMGMSVGNIYNYFSSKELLAKEIIKYSSDILGAEIRTVNEEECPIKEKIRKIVAVYFEMASSKPQHINYFLRVYLANKEVFKDGCEGMLCVSSFVTELMIFFEDGVSKKELRNQDFFSAFGLFMGYLGGFVFLNGEGVLDKDLRHYVDDISLNIYNALKQ